MSAELDAELAAAAPGVPPPAVAPTEAVLVAGPWLAGVSSLTAALRRRMPERQFVESDELAPESAPVAVVFAVSAVAPLTESDCVVLDNAVRHTDLVIGALTKIDVHRDWQAVLAVDAGTVAARTARLREMPWVGVAAAPARGTPELDDLVATLRRELAGSSLARRNRLRAWETHINDEIDAVSTRTADAESAALRGRREDVLRDARLSRAERAIALRSRIQQARVQLGYFARNRCASVRTELSEDAAAWGGLPGQAVGAGRRHALRFQNYVADRAAQVVEEVDAGVTEHLRDIAAELGLDPPPVPPPAPVPDIGGPGLASRRLEMQLMMLLGAGFGLGVALAAGRLFAGLAPGLTVVGAVAGGLLGLLLTVWVVGLRGLLHDRALLERWVGRVAATLREDTEALVAARVLVAEVHFTGVAAATAERAVGEAAREVAAIDARLRERALAEARAQAAAAGRLPALRAVLKAINADPNNLTNSITAQ